MPAGPITICSGGSHVTARQGGQGKARQGKVGQGKARQGKARQGKARQGKARQGRARQGKVRQGKERQGKARQGKARKKGKARQRFRGDISSCDFVARGARSACLERRRQASRCTPSEHFSINACAPLADICDFSKRGTAAVPGIYRNYSRRTVLEVVRGMTPKTLRHET